jgi:magnesium chelatase family protein
MLARRLTTILPEMTLAEAIETTHIPRAAGRTGGRTTCVTTRPCCAREHTIPVIRAGHGRHAYCRA